MENEYTTSHGIVKVSDVYFSKALLRKARNLTLTPENNDGWGVSKEFDASKKLSRKIVEKFAAKAIGYL